MLNEVIYLEGTENRRQYRGVGRDKADIVETSVKCELRGGILVTCYEIGWSSRASICPPQLAIAVCIELTHPLILEITIVSVEEVCRDCCCHRPVGRSCP